MRIQLPVGLLQLNNGNNNIFTTSSTTSTNNGNNHRHNFTSIITSQQQNVNDYSNSEEITDTYFYEDNPNITITSDNTVTFRKSIFNQSIVEQCTENRNELIDGNNLNIVDLNCENLGNKIGETNDNERNYGALKESDFEKINYTVPAKDDHKSEVCKMFIEL